MRKPVFLCVLASVTLAMLAVALWWQVARGGGGGGRESFDSDVVHSTTLTYNVLGSDTPDFQKEYSQGLTIWSKRSAQPKIRRYSADDEKPDEAANRCPAGMHAFRKGTKCCSSEMDGSGQTLKYDSSTCYLESTNCVRGAPEATCFNNSTASVGLNRHRAGLEFQLPTEGGKLSFRDGDGDEKHVFSADGTCAHARRVRASEVKALNGIGIASVRSGVLQLQATELKDPLSSDDPMQLQAPWFLRDLRSIKTLLSGRADIKPARGAGIDANTAYVTGRDNMHIGSVKSDRIASMRGVYATQSSYDTKANSRIAGSGNEVSLFSTKFSPTSTPIELRKDAIYGVGVTDKSKDGKLTDAQFKMLNACPNVSRRYTIPRPSMTSASPMVVTNQGATLGAPGSNSRGDLEFAPKDSGKQNWYMFTQ